MRLRISSASAWMRLARSWGLVRFQPGSASRAAWAAASASAAVASGASAKVSSVAGLTIPYAPADPGTHSPPISSWYPSVAVAMCTSSSFFWWFSGPGSVVRIVVVGSRAAI